MGQSTDAILFYGYCWGDEAQLWDDGDEWFEVLAKRRGAVSPWDIYRNSGAEAEHNRLPYGDQNAAYEAWKATTGFEAMLTEWDAIREGTKSEHPNIDVGSHCSCDYPMPYICIATTERRAWRGSPIAFDPQAMAQDESDINWDGWLGAFVEALDVDVTDAQGPGWFLVSNWC